MMAHLRFHPLANTRPDQRHAGPIDAWSAWESQVTEMNELCRSHSESWAWEYLWKEWYCPERWKNWAWAVCNIIPIINTNVIVESLWGTLKRHFLRSTSKTSRRLEYLGEVIMNQYLPTCINKIRAHCRHRAKPSWYDGLIKEWRQSIQTLLEEEVNDLNAETQFNRQQTQYHCSLDDWWCGCHAYKRSPYHVCKHLIRFRSLTDNRRMTIPFYDQVWRQFLSPTLWREGVHEPHQLVTHTLELDDAPVHNAPDLDLKQQDIVLPIVDIVAQEGDEEGEELGHREVDTEEEDWDNAFGNMPEHIALVDQRLRVAQVKEAIALRMRRAQAVVDYMSDLLTYDDGHPHLLEVPDTDNLRSWDKHTRSLRPRYPLGFLLFAKFLPSEKFSPRTKKSLNVVLVLPRSLQSSPGCSLSWGSSRPSAVSRQSLTTLASSLWPSPPAVSRVISCHQTSSLHPSIHSIGFILYVTSASSSIVVCPPQVLKRGIAFLIHRPSVSKSSSPNPLHQVSEISKSSSIEPSIG
jgi:hypothetical protein